MSVALARYDAACRAIAEAVSVDEVLAIRDKAVQMAACARIAKNHQVEADAVAIRMRATRRLDQLRQAQKETVGLATGGEHGGRGRIDGVRKTPSIVRPTLAMQGIDKNLARQARALGALSEEEFEAAVADAHDRVARAVRNTVREIEIGQERESPRAAQRKATETETKAARKVDKPQPRKKKVTEGKKPKPSQRELEAKQAHIDELEAAREHDNDLAEQLQAAKIKIAGLESEIEEAKAAAKPAPRSKSRCSVCREKKLAVLRSVFICDRCVEIHEIGEAAPPADDGLDIPEFLPRSAGP